MNIYGDSPLTTPPYRRNIARARMAVNAAEWTTDIFLTLNLNLD